MTEHPSGLPGPRRVPDRGSGLKAGHSPDAGCLASVHDVALLDLDGVVYVGASAVPHASAALDAALVQHGMRSVFVTNNASRPPEAVAAHLRELGVRATAADVVTSAQAGARVLAGMLEPGSPVLAIGGPGVSAALSERGLLPVTSVDDGAVAVMQGFGPQVGWHELAEGSLAIGRGLPWVATNLDSTIPTPRGRVLGNGSLVAALRHASGVVPLVAGKPEPPLMHESVERAGALSPIVIGDRLDTDIEGATNTGLPSMLVLTGVTDWQDLVGAEPAHRPTYLGRDLRALLEPAPEVEVLRLAHAVQARCARAVARVPMVDAAQESEHDLAGDPDRGAGSHHRLWWIPEPLRSAGRGNGEDLDTVDLDVVRALVWASWAIGDAGARIVGAAELHVAGP